jgi:hypothetical protein
MRIDQLGRVEFYALPQTPLTTALNLTGPSWQRTLTVVLLAPHPTGVRLLYVRMEVTATKDNVRKWIAERQLSDKSNVCWLQTRSKREMTLQPRVKNPVQNRLTYQQTATVLPMADCPRL